MTEEGRDRLFKAWAEAAERSAPALDANIRRRVLSAQAERGRLAPQRWALLGGLAMAVAVAIALILRTPAAPSFQVSGHAGRVGEWLDATPASELQLRFSEGTRVSLSNGSRGRVARTTRGGAEIELSSGSVDAEVSHLPGADWSFGAGPFEVTVTGTHLNVAWAPASGIFELSVSRGSVLVKGPAIVGLQAVRAGQVCRVDLGRHAMELGQLGVPQDKSVAEQTPPAEPSPSSIPQPAESSAPLPAGSALSRATSAESLLEEARAARLAGRSDLERAALLAVRKRAKGSAAAAQAAFLLGKSSSAAEAAAWFQVYLREEPQGLLAREAAGRLIESYRAADDVNSARQAASRYLARYPNGPHAALARQALAARSEGQD